MVAEQMYLINQESQGEKVLKMILQTFTHIVEIIVSVGLYLKPNFDNGGRNNTKGTVNVTPDRIKI